MPIKAFYKQLLKKPRTIGAVLPSSRHLSYMLAAMVSPLLPEQKVLEIGPGTGVITQALLKSGVVFDQLTLLEYCQSMVDELQQQWPLLSIVQGDAKWLGQDVVVDQQFNWIISSLPLFSMSLSDRNQVVRAINGLLLQNGHLISLTYNLFQRSPFQLLPGIEQVSHQTIIRNIPPARIDHFIKVK